MKEIKMKELPRHIKELMETVKQAEKEQKETIKKLQPRAIRKEVVIPGLEWMSEIR